MDDENKFPSNGGNKPESRIILTSKNDDWYQFHPIRNSSFFRKNNNGTFYDGGMTNSFDLTYDRSNLNQKTPIGTLDSYNITFSNVMYGPYRNYKRESGSVTDYDADQRPFIGVIELSYSGNFEKKYDVGNNLYNNSIITTSVNYHDIKLTNDVQSWWHKVNKVELPDYTANEAKQGLSGSFSANKVLTYEFFDQDRIVNMWSNVEVGATVGDYTGADIGLGLQAGTYRKINTSTKAEGVTLTHYSTSAKEKNNWNVSLDYNLNIQGRNTVFDSQEYHFEQSERQGGDKVLIRSEENYQVVTPKKFISNLSLNAEIEIGRFLLGAGVSVSQSAIEKTEKFSTRRATLIDNGEIKLDKTNTNIKLSDTPKLTGFGEVKIGYRF